jgi:hypothetical protein
MILDRADRDPLRLRLQTFFSGLTLAASDNGAVSFGRAARRSLDSTAYPSPDASADGLANIAGIRAQRAEVEALIAYTHAAEGEAKALAWWRLQQVRRRRCAAMGTAANRLPPLPPPPPGALSRVQALRVRMGWLTVTDAAPQARFARQLRRG